MNEFNALGSWFLVLGILFLIFGFVLMILPVVGSITLELLFGLVLLVLGITEVVLAFTARKWTGFLFVLLSGIITVIVSFILLFNPIPGLIALTLLLGLFLCVDGLIKIVKAFSLKSGYGWEWMLFDGILSILIGVLIVLAWPSDSTWVLGLLFGIYLLFGGLTFVMLSQATKYMRNAR